MAYDKYKTAFSELYVKEVQMDEVFAEADILSLHVPLTDETRNLVDKDYLDNFKKPIYLINTARGQCVDISALMDAIDNGKVPGAALDVLEYEKLSILKPGCPWPSRTIQSADQQRSGDSLPPHRRVNS